MSESTNEGQQAPSVTEEIAQTPASETVPESGTEQTSPETPAELSEPEPKKTPWFQRRIDELTREKHEERRLRETLEARLRTPAVAPQPGQQAPTQPQEMFLASEVERLVEQRFSEATFNDQCNRIADTAAAKFADFGSAKDTFAMLGGVSRDFLEGIAALGTEAGAKVYYDLGKNPEEAQRILAMKPVQMAMELAKRAAAAPKPIPVSKVPDPIRPVTGSNTRSDAEPDGKDPVAYRAWFNLEMAKRNKR